MAENLTKVSVFYFQERKPQKLNKLFAFFVLLVCLFCFSIFGCGIVAYCIAAWWTIFCRLTQLKRFRNGCACIQGKNSSNDGGDDSSSSRSSSGNNNHIHQIGENGSICLLISSFSVLSSLHPNIVLFIIFCFFGTINAYTHKSATRRCTFA